MRYLAADIALGLGAASVVTAAIVFLARPEREVRTGFALPNSRCPPDERAARQVAWSQAF